MAQDLKQLFEKERSLSKAKLSEGHEARFMKKLDEELPQQQQQTTSFMWIYKIAASAIIVFGLGYAIFSMVTTTEQPINNQEVVGNTKSLEDISPQLKKVEDYYLANINLELSKIEYSPETKELFDGYVARLDELSKEYEALSNELFNSGPDEDTVTALIDNLKLRLNLLHRLKEKLSELNNDASPEAEIL